MPRATLRSMMFASFAAALLALCPGIATAATITVTTLLDNNGGCTLRNAILSSNDGTSHGGCTAGTASNTIVFSVNGTILLGGVPLNIYNNSLTISGNGTANTIIDAQTFDHAFDNLDPGVPVAMSITWQNLTIKRGNALATGPTAYSSAGAIFIDTLTTASITNCVLSASTAEASGGAIENRGVLTISDSTLEGNVAGGEGGAIRNTGTLTISNSTFSNNSANSGGAIWHRTGTAGQTLGVVNSTFVGNSATAFGGAISADDATGIGPVTLTHVTITGNNSAAGVGGGVYMNNGAAFNVDRSIIAANTAATGPDCGVGASKTLNSLNYNVFSSLAGCNVSGTTANNVVTASPGLGALGDYGGPTQTVPLLGSPAVNIAPTCATGSDQRGVTRPIGGRCDAGAFEQQLIDVIPASLPSPQVGVLYSHQLIAINGTGPYTFTLSNLASAWVTLSSSGLLSGTPPNTGMAQFTVTVTDTFSTATGGRTYIVSIAPAGGGLFRAYLSSAGSDANPCTLPLPCRHLPAAQAAVAHRGEVWMLDSANFNTGVVHITKSVTILALPGVAGSIVANGADAIQVIADGVEVTLRNVKILNLAGAANTGIVTGCASQLTLEGSEVFGLATGIAGGCDGLLNVRGTTIRDNTTGVSVGSGRAAIDESALLNNATVGLLVERGVARVVNGTIAGSSTGVSVGGTDGRFAQVALSGTQLTGNGTAVSVSTAASGNTAEAMLEEVTVTHNTTGVSLSGLGTKAAFTLQNNTFLFNGTDVTGGSLTALPAK